MARGRVDVGDGEPGRGLIVVRLMKGVMPVEAVALETSGPGSEKRTRFFGFVGVCGTARVGLLWVVVDVDVEEATFLAGLGLPRPELALRLRWTDRGRSSSFSSLSLKSCVCSAMTRDFFQYSQTRRI